MIGLAAAIFGVSFAAVVRQSRNNGSDDIQSWTCRWADGAREVQQMFPDGLAGLAAPRNFERVCSETKAGFDLLAALIALQGLVVVTTALCTWTEVKKRNLEKRVVFSEKTLMVDGTFS